MGYDVFQFGVLNLDGKIQSVPQCPTGGGDIPQYDGKGAISLGTSVPGKGITWIKPNGSNLLVADRVLLVKVSWEDLDKSGFVAGKTVLLNGHRFGCRLLQVGEKEAVLPNEWDKILDATNAYNTLWHFEDVCFWGADISVYGYGASPRAVRGYLSARHWNSINATHRYVDAGFRPALEPLGADNLKSDCTLDGTNFYLSSIPGGDGFCPILQPVQKDVFTGIPDGQQVRMYTIMEDGHPIHVGEPTKDLARLTLTDRYFGDEYLVSWVISNGIAVASQSLPQQGDCQKERR